MLALRAMRRVQFRPSPKMKYGVPCVKLAILRQIGFTGRKIFCYRGTTPIYYQLYTSCPMTQLRLATGVERTLWSGPSSRLSALIMLSFGERPSREAGTQSKNNVRSRQAQWIVYWGNGFNEQEAQRVSELFTRLRKLKKLSAIKLITCSLRSKDIFDLEINQDQDTLYFGFDDCEIDGRLVQSGSLILGKALDRRHHRDPSRRLTDPVASSQTGSTRAGGM